MKEEETKLYPNVGFLLISKENDPGLVALRLNEIQEQEFKPERVIVCVSRAEFVPETSKILKKYKQETGVDFNIVQLHEYDSSDLELVDECYRYNQGFLAVFRSNYHIPSNFLEKFHDVLKEGHRITYVAPYNEDEDELSGMIINCPVFRLLRGNKAVVHPDGTRDTRTYAERVAAMEQTIEGEIDGE